MLQLKSFLAPLALASSLTFSTGLNLNEVPVDFGSGHIVDTQDALGNNQAKLQAVLDELASKTGVRVFVSYVSEFENPNNSQDWAEQTADFNALGKFSVLLAIAVDARDYGIDADYELLSDSDLDTLEQKYLLPKLANDQWYEAAAQFSNGIAHIFGEKLSTVETQNNGSSDSAGGIHFLWFVVPAGGILGALILFFRRKSKSQLTNSEPGKMSNKELERSVGSALVQIDDALKLSEQELGFAEAQFGKAAVKEFRTVLLSADEKVRKAFQLKQQLDDSIPDTPEQIRSWSVEILELCQRANEQLEAQKQGFEELRQIEKNAPETLAELKDSAVEIQTKLGSLQSKVAELTAKYSGPTISTIADNPKQAQELYSFASKQLETAEQELNSADPSEAALAIRAAQQSYGQIDSLVEAVENTKKLISESEQKLAESVSELNQDLLQSESLAASNSALVSSLSPIQNSAKQLLSKLNGSDPVAELSAVEKTHTELDQLLQTTRNALEQEQRVRQSAERAILAAQSRISTAQDYLTTRRGGIGLDARTRLADASRRLADAQSQFATKEFDSAFAQAQSAQQLAESAIQLATSQVSTNYGSSNDAPMLGGILGGILGGMISSGGRSSNSWGSNSGWGGYNNNSGRSSGGLFGGSSGSSWGSSGGSRRSSGSSWGGSSSSRGSSGRRSRGGRF